MSVQLYEDAPARLLTKAQARRLTEEIRQTGAKLWDLLYQAHEGQAHKALGYDEWKNYVAIEFGFSEANSFRLIDQGRVALAIESATGDSRARESISQRQAQLLKDNLPAVIDEVRAMIAEGIDPMEAVRICVHARRRARRAAQPKSGPVAVVNPRELLDELLSITPAKAARVLRSDELTALRRWLREVSERVNR